MKYALGNMLNGAGGLNPDGLSLDLQFATDKTLTARKGPTPVFTRASTATFVGSNGLIQSAAINAARFDHDPVTLACKGLLIEESRTNSISQSENFASALSWVKAGGSISSVANVEPDGNANSELFSEDATTGAHRLFQAFVGTIGTIYTLSVFLKFNGRAEVSLENRSITGNPFVVFNIQNGTIGIVPAVLTAAIQAYPNGWYRCSITGTATLAGGNYLINGYLAAATYIGLNGPAFYIYGAQVEAGSFPTSYIPTTTASLARSADVCSISGANFTGMYNEFAGTLFCEQTLNGVGLITIPTTAFIGGEQNGIQMRDTANNLSGVITSDESLYFDSSMSGSSFRVPRKSAIAFQNEGSAILCLNGTLGTQDNSITLPSDATGGQSPTQLSLFRGQFSTVKAFRYYKKRLPNAKLQSLTV